MRIQVTEIGDVVTKTSVKGKPYKSVEVNFINEGGRPAKRVVTSYSEAFKPLLAAQREQEFEITTQVDGEYTNWVDATPVESEKPAKANGKAGKATTPIKSTYETPEERAKKQVYIVRQSSIANALTYFKDDKATTVENVLEVARQFEAFVFDAGPSFQSDDIDGVEVD